MFYCFYRVCLATLKSFINKTGISKYSVFKFRRSFLASVKKSWPFFTQTLHNQKPKYLHFTWKVVCHRSINNLSARLDKTKTLVSSFQLTVHLHFLRKHQLLYVLPYFPSYTSINTFVLHLLAYSALFQDLKNLLWNWWSVNRRVFADIWCQQRKGAKHSSSAFFFFLVKQTKLVRKSRRRYHVCQFSAELVCFCRIPSETTSVWKTQTITWIYR